MRDQSEHEDDEEREVWDALDPADYADWAAAKKDYLADVVELHANKPKAKPRKGRKMKQQCCDNHDKMFSDHIQCGMAGMGTAIVCCRSCPSAAWYAKNQPTRTIKYYETDFTDQQKAEW